MTTNHHKNQHHEKKSTHDSEDDWNSPSQVKRQKRMRHMTIVAVALMLLALIGYVLSNDESVIPDQGEEPRVVGE